jgi:DNA modification methylase
MFMDYQIYNEDYHDVLPTINEDIIIVTDPPYNIRFKYNLYQDNLPENDYYNNLKGLIYNYPCVLIAYHEILYKLAAYSNKAPDKVVEWIYPSNTNRQHRGVAYYNITPDLNNVKQPYKNRKDKRIQQLIANGSNGARSYDWWEIPQVKNVSHEKGVHPCPTPVKLMENIIKTLPQDYVICDPFMGGGSAGVACAILNRKFIGMEIDKLYFDEAKKKLGSMLQL